MTLLALPFAYRRRFLAGAFLAGLFLLSAFAQTPAAPILIDRVWMLDGISIAPEHAGLKTQISRTHPIGRLFLECRADGGFTLLRGDESRQQGRWALSDEVLAFQRIDDHGQAAGEPLAYRVEEVAQGRLILAVVLPEGLPTVRLEFSPSQWPQWPR